MIRKIPPNPRVEAVASAMRAAYGKHRGEAVTPWVYAAEEPKAAWRACAKAAIRTIEGLKAE